MDPLPLNRRVLVWLYMFPPVDGASRWNKLASMCFSSAVCITLVGCVASSVVFVFRFIAIDLEDSLYAMFPLIACSGLLYTHIVAILSRHDITKLFEKLSQIYQTSEQNLLTQFF